MSTETKAVQRRNSDAIDALNEYMDLRDELGQMEGSGEDECSCNPNNFHTCDFCKHRGGLLDRSRILLEGWGDNWAVMLNEDTLPFQDWCACGHVSGQHGARYPHVCAVDNGCEKECYGFRSRLGHAAPEMLEALLKARAILLEEMLAEAIMLDEAHQNPRLEELKRQIDDVLRKAKGVSL